MGLIVWVVAVFMAPLNFKLFILARSNAVYISLYDLALFRLRRISPEVILDAAIRIKRVGLAVDIDLLQQHVLAGGHLDSVVDALVSSKGSKLKYTFEDLCRIDLAGRNVYEAVDSYVTPQVIKCPGKDSGQKAIIGVAKDGIRLSVQVRVTVRVDLRALVGGAGEKTVKARVGEATISAIGASLSHKEILENPDRISRGIQEANIVKNTAWIFENFLVA